MAGETALAARVPCLFTRPLVRGSLLVGCLPTLTGNLFLPHSIHGCKATVFFSHVEPPCTRSAYPSSQRVQPRCHDVTNLKVAKKQWIFVRRRAALRAQQACALTRSRRTPCNSLLARQQRCACEALPHAITAQQFENFVESGADTSSSHHHARSVYQCRRLDTARVGDRPQQYFELCSIERLR